MIDHVRETGTAYTVERSGIPVVRVVPIEKRLPARPATKTWRSRPSPPPNCFTASNGSPACGGCARGQMIGADDLMIAATAVSLDYDVATRDLRSFPKIKALRVRQW